MKNMKRNYLNLSVLLVFILALSVQSCVVVKQDQVAIKRRAGKLVGNPVSEGMRMYNPFFSTYLKVPIRNVNFKIDLDIPSKEGLTIKSEMSILYRIEKEKVMQVLREVGVNYEENLISPVFRSALADVSAKFYAKDMHTGKRAEIETAVKDQMMKILSEKGFIIDAVLMKRITLPASLSRAIEEKLAAEQDAQRMEFVLLREKQEAERKTIEAQGIRDSQKILAEGLTDAIIKYTSIEAFKELSKSPNAKIIITDGKAPFLINQ